MVLAPCRISLPLPDLVREVAVILSARSELTVRSEELFWTTIRSAPPGPFSVPPVKAVAPLPVRSNPPEERASVLPALRVIVVAAVSLKELMVVSSKLAKGLAARLTLLAASQVVGSELVV